MMEVLILSTNRKQVKQTTNYDSLIVNSIPTIKGMLMSTIKTISVSPSLLILIGVSICCISKGCAQKALPLSQHLQQTNPNTAIIQNKQPVINIIRQQPSGTLYNSQTVQQIVPQVHSENQQTLAQKDNSSSNQPTGSSIMYERFVDAEMDLFSEEGKNLASFAEAKNSTSKKSSSKKKNQPSKNRNRTEVFDDETSADSSDSNEIFDDVDEAAGLAGTQKEPDCASHGRYYCTYKEEYPLKLVTEVTKYYKWPLEKLFRDLHAQIMPKLAPDSTGNLVCDSITRVVRPGWARNTNERWLVVINNDNYHQYVTEVVCQYGTNSRCNFIPPCYYSSCQQRYNTQKLLVIDPSNPYRGPFLSEFLFPSCCVCYVPSASDNFKDKYRSSPATIYQRTMQQESANNLHPPQIKPVAFLEDAGPYNLADSQSPSPSHTSSSSSIAAKQSANENQASGPGEIRREGEQYRNTLQETISSMTDSQKSKDNNLLGDFPRLGLSDSLINEQSSRGSQIHHQQ